MEVAGKSNACESKAEDLGGSTRMICILYLVKIEKRDSVEVSGLLVWVCLKDTAFRKENKRRNE